MSALKHLERMALIAGKSESLAQFLAPLLANCSSQDEFEQHLSDVLDYCAPAMFEMEQSWSMLSEIGMNPEMQTVLKSAIAEAQLNIFQMTCLHLANS